MEKKNEVWFELHIESDLRNLELVSNFIAECMRSSGIQNQKDIFDVQLAVDEACTNIMEHAYSGQKAGKITVSCRMADSKKEFIIKLQDFGKPFDPTSVLSPRTDANLDEREVGGLGIFFMKTLMQSVKYDFNDKGNELTMVKLLN